jgi:L-threonylcarbamoyladenylate synthase
LIEVAGCPLTAPSANKSGEKNLRTADEVRRSLGDTVDLIIDAGPAPGGKVSTLLDTTVSPPVLIRQGAVTREKIESILKMECSLAS